MTLPDLDALKAQLKQHEGVRLKPYVDTTGHLTIGVGRTLSDRGITPDEADLMLEHDIVSTYGWLLVRYPWMATLDAVRLRAVIDLAFNIGVEGLGGFVRFLAALRNGQYEEAASEMIASKWASQVHGRATTLAQMMRTGVA
jgi:lysozyme